MHTHYHRNKFLLQNFRQQQLFKFAYFPAYVCVCVWRNGRAAVNMYDAFIVMKASSRWYYVYAQFKCILLKKKEINSKQNRNVQCNEFYYDISAYGNLHASTASKCLVKIRKLIIMQFSLWSMYWKILLYLYFYICNILWIRRC